MLCPKRPAGDLLAIIGEPFLFIPTNLDSPDRLPFRLDILEAAGDSMLTEGDLSIDDEEDSSLSSAQRI